MCMRWSELLIATKNDKIDDDDGDGDENNNNNNNDDYRDDSDVRRLYMTIEDISMYYA